MRYVDPNETVDDIYKNSSDGTLGGDLKSVEVIVSNMETYEFTRMVTVPIVRSENKNASERDDGDITGFGDPVERLIPSDEARGLGRFDQLLKPLGVAS